MCSFKNSVTHTAHSHWCIRTPAVRCDLMWCACDTTWRRWHSGDDSIKIIITPQSHPVMSKRTELWLFPFRFSGEEKIMMSGTAVPSHTLWGERWCIITQTDTTQILSVSSFRLRHVFSVSVIGAGKYQGHNHQNTFRFILWMKHRVSDSKINVLFSVGLRERVQKRHSCPL